MGWKSFPTKPKPSETAGNLRKTKAEVEQRAQTSRESPGIRHTSSSDCQAVRRGLRSALCLVSTEARPIWVSALSRVSGACRLSSFCWNEPFCVWKLIQIKRKARCTICWEAPVLLGFENGFRRKRPCCQFPHPEPKNPHGLVGAVVAMRLV